MWTDFEFMWAHEDHAHELRAQADAYRRARLVSGRRKQRRARRDAAARSARSAAVTAVR